MVAVKEEAAAVKVAVPFDRLDVLEVFEVVPKFKVPAESVADEAT